jgi:hypothetical protein
MMRVTRCGGSCGGHTNTVVGLREAWLGSSRRLQTCIWCNARPEPLIRSQWRLVVGAALTPSPLTSIARKIPFPVTLPQAIGRTASTRACRPPRPNVYPLQASRCEDQLAHQQRPAKDRAVCSLRTAKSRDHKPGADGRRRVRPRLQFLCGYRYSGPDEDTDKRQSHNCVSTSTLAGLNTGTQLHSVSVRPVANCNGHLATGDAVVSGLDDVHAAMIEAARCYVLVHDESHGHV